mgnify:CR=1 FL=1
MNSIAKQIVGLGLLAGLLLLLNTLYYKFADQSVSTEAFEYPLAVVYSLFFILSSIVMVILHLVNKKSKEQLGYTFLLATGAKMAICYLFARPIIAKGEAATAEKVNFFIIFIVFLVIEAYYTARLLNNKQ